MSNLLPVADLASCYVVIDDACKEFIPHRICGRLPCLSSPEIIAILVYNVVTLHQQTLKDLWLMLTLYHEKDFHVPAYSTFVQEVHRALPLMQKLLSESLVPAPINFIDATFLEVCTLPRAQRYSVARDHVAFGKNHQGWHFGFKLHVAVNRNGLLSSILITPGNIYDAQVLPDLVKKYMKICVGDSAYNASVMRKYIWNKYNILIVASPHFTQRKKITAWWQTKLLSMRSKIESSFDYLKQHLHLVSSFPRSLAGYFVHYFRILLGYQFGLLFRALNEATI
jgi:hypothetical protein